MGEKEQLHILVVDDSPDDTLLLERELKRGEWEITLKRVDTREAMGQILENKCCDLVICDYVIPGFGGMEALKLFKSFNLDIPFILISGKITEEMAVLALQEGAQDFISKEHYARLLPAIHRGIERMTIIKERKENVEALKKSLQRQRQLFESSRDALMLLAPPLWKFTGANMATVELFGAANVEEFISLGPWEVSPQFQPDGRPSSEKSQEMIATAMEKRSNFFEWTHQRLSGETFAADVLLTRIDIEGEEPFLQATVRDITERKNAEETLHNSLMGIIRAISDIVEMRDPYTAGHQKKVSSLACAIAKEMGMTPHQIEGLKLAAEIHDVGKIQLPAEILSKPTGLSDIEYMLIKTHPEAGYEILKEINFPWPIAEIIRQHHEKLDGSGYPHGLKGNEVLLESRILTVADIVEAVASHRPYRPALGIDVALEEILQERGSKLDANVVDTCISLFREGRFSF